MPKVFYFVALLLAPWSAAASQAFWLPAIISDHMLVQAGQPIPLWGRDLPGRPINASLNGVSAHTKVGRDGRWQLRLPSQAPGGPYQLLINGSQPRAIQDVLIGELWLAAGQSNMELPLGDSTGGVREATAAKDTQLRFFTLERRSGQQPLDEALGSWKVCDPAAAQSFSAVGYHFGKTLRQKLDVPVAVVLSAWGGSAAEAWVPRDEKTEALWSTGEDFDLWFSDTQFGGAHGKRIQALERFPRWGHSELEGSQGSFESVTQAVGPPLGHYHGHLLGGAWASLRMKTGDGSGINLSGMDSLELKVKGSGKFTVFLAQPSISDHDYYAQGVFTLSPEWQPLRIDLSKMVQAGWGAPRAFTPQAISGIYVTLEAPYWFDEGAVMFNGMVAPLGRLPFQGVLWYQGESNAARAAQYQLVLSTLFKSWREAWGRADLPFFVVQLHNYADAGNRWGALRNAQRLAVQGDAHSALIGTLGLGEKHESHPRDKKPVGQRLAAAALAQVYRQPVGPLTPMLIRVVRNGDKAVLSFSHAENGLQAVGKGGGLELAGADGVFHAAKFKAAGDGISVWADDVKVPKQLRHAWADDPASYLRAEDGLPVPSFLEALP